jgi:muramoyltetrapeptide carboxypeptidase
MVTKRVTVSAQFLVPPAVERGDHVRVIAPAGPFDRPSFERGVRRLGERYKVLVDPGVYSRRGFLAGSDGRRLAELDDALRCTRAKAIVAARGGVGCTRIAHLADFDALIDHPKWLVGFSDITALHAEALRRRVASLHAANVTGVGAMTAANFERWCSALQTPLTPRHYQLESLVPGSAMGTLVGGNLSLIHTTALVGRWAPPPGAILFVEEVGEPPYRIDRMLTSLRLSGALDNIAALVIGQITDAQAGPHGVSARRVLEEFAADLGVPTAWGLAAGHGEKNLPLHLGLEARVSGGDLSTPLSSS